MKVKVVIVDLEVSPVVKKWAVRLGIPVAVLLGGGAVAYAAGLVTWTTGQTLTAADLNGNFSQLQSEITALQAQVHPSSAFHAWRTVALAAASGSFATVPFDTVEYDLGSEYSPATGTFSPKTDGIYLLTCTLEYINPTTTTITQADWSASLQKNGVAISGSGAVDLVDGINTANGNSVTASTIVKLAAGDAIVCQSYQNSGVNVALSADTRGRSSFAAARLY